jgi:glutathione peroxidase
MNKTIGLLGMAFILCVGKISAQEQKQKTDTSIYSISIDSIVGKRKIDLSSFKGKQLLIVTTATLDTSFYQVLELKRLYLQSNNKMRILLVPTNDFNKEPAGNAQLAKFLQRFQLPFTIAAKTIITGAHMHPLFKWLTQTKTSSEKPVTITGSFQKFLINEKGELTNVLDAKEKPSANNEIKNIIKGKG